VSAASRARWELRRAFNQARNLRAMDRHQTGDFDDLGRVSVARNYHHQQATKRGRLFT
jgi:hypothetical protein